MRTSYMVLRCSGFPRGVQPDRLAAAGLVAGHRPHNTEARATRTVNPVAVAALAPGPFRVASGGGAGNPKENCHED